MDLLLSITFSIMSLFNIEYVEPEEAFFPQKQELTEEYTKACYYFSKKGTLLKTEISDDAENHFYVEVAKKIYIEIDLKGNSNNFVGREIGYLARILSAEALTFRYKGSYRKISMFTRVCIAESIRNRKESQFRSYAKYNTYEGVIKNTGYATGAKEFRHTEQWLLHPVAKQRFIEEVLPVAIFEFFNKTEFTNGAIGFFTPAMMNKSKMSIFEKHTLIHISGIDAYYEFTFWKI